MRVPVPISARLELNGDHSRDRESRGRVETRTAQPATREDLNLNPLGAIRRMPTTTHQARTKPIHAQRCGISRSDTADCNPQALPRAEPIWTQNGHLIKSPGRAADDANDELRGPQELLGCLAAQALLVHTEEPAQATALLARIAERRREWALPHLSDRDVATVEGTLGATPAPSRSRSIGSEREDSRP